MNNDYSKFEIVLKRDSNPGDIDNMIVDIEEALCRSRTVRSMTGSGDSCSE